LRRNLKQLTIGTLSFNEDDAMRQTIVSRYQVECALSDGFRRWSKVAERNVSVAGLNLTGLRALRILSKDGPRSMATLAREKGMTPAGMTIVVDNLEEAGLVRRVRSDADRRTINVAITGKGGERSRLALKLHDKFIERTIGGVTSQEMASFLAILNRIVVASEGMNIANAP
jgi:DNA-binding MarR family transcriptional regulator